MISARGSPSTGKPTIQSVQKVLPSHQLGLSIANRVYCNYDRRAEPPFMWPKLQYRQVARESISTSGSSSKGGPSKGGRSHVSVIETNATMSHEMWLSPAMWLSHETASPNLSTSLRSRER